MISDVFSELTNKEFIINGIVRHITKKGIGNLLIVETKDFIRSNPEAKLESANVRFDKSTNQYLFTYCVVCKEGSKTYQKTVMYITHHQMINYFKAVKNR